MQQNDRSIRVVELQMFYIICLVLNTIILQIQELQKNIPNVFIDISEITKKF